MQHFSLIWLRLSFASHRRTSAVMEVQITRSKCAATAVAKKNAGNKAGVGMQFLKNQQVFQSKSRLSRLFRDQRR